MNPPSRSIRPLLLVALLGFSILAANADPLADARTRFSEGEYSQAAELFEKAAASNPPSAGLYFELGRTYAALDDNARAALNFRRALLLNPGLTPAATALRTAEVDLGIPARATTWTDRLATFVPMDPLTLGGTLLLWIGAFLLLPAIFHSPRRRYSLPISLLVAGAACLTVVFLTDPRIAARDVSVVLTDSGVTLRKSPIENAETVATVPPGTPVRVLSQHGRWFFGRLASGTEGWFPSEGIVRLVPTT